MAHYEDHKIAECRLYTAGWGFVMVSTAVVGVALLAISSAVPAWPPFLAAIAVAMVGYPCVVLAAWGDCVNKIVDSVLGIFKRGKEIS